MIQLIKKLNNLLSVIAGISVVVMMLWIVLDILVRAVFHQSIIGTAQIVEEYLMVILVYFGLSYTYLKNEHLVVDLVINKMPQRIRDVFEVINHLIVMVIALYIGWIYFGTAVEFQEKGTTSSSLLAYPLAPIMYVLDFGLFVLFITCILRIILTLHRFGKKTEPRGEV